MRTRSFIMQVRSTLTMERPYIRWGDYLNSRSLFLHIFVFTSSFSLVGFHYSKKLIVDICDIICKYLIFILQSSQV